jgi:hypothetical protein
LALALEAPRLSVAITTGASPAKTRASHQFQQIVELRKHLAEEGIRPAPSLDMSCVSSN